MSLVTLKEFQSYQRMHFSLMIRRARIEWIDQEEWLYELGARALEAIEWHRKYDSRSYTIVALNQFVQRLAKQITAIHMAGLWATHWDMVI